MNKVTMDPASPLQADRRDNEHRPLNDFDDVDDAPDADPHYT